MPISTLTHNITIWSISTWRSGLSHPSKSLKYFELSLTENYRIWRNFIRYLCVLHIHSVKASHLTNILSGDPTLNPDSAKMNLLWQHLLIKLILLFILNLWEATTEVWNRLSNNSYKRRTKWQSISPVIYGCAYSNLPPSGAWFCPDACLTRTHNSIHVKHAWRSSIFLIVVKALSNAWLIYFYILFFRNIRYPAQPGWTRSISVIRPWPKAQWVPFFFSFSFLLLF